jgi:hypothetical protein
MCVSSHLELHHHPRPNQVLKKLPRLQREREKEEGKGCVCSFHHTLSSVITPAPTRFSRSCPGSRGRERRKRGRDVCVRSITP